MYVHPLQLGRFDIPDSEQWPLEIKYFPEPPQLIRGAMNPWELERKRVLWMAEEAAWKQIKALQIEYRAALADYNWNLNRANQLLGELEHQTGQKGLSKIMGSKGFQAGAMAVTMTNPYGAAIAAALVAINFLEMGFKILSGEAKRKKKRIQQLTDALQQVGRDIDRLAGIMNGLAQRILALTNAKEQATAERNAIEAQDKAINAAQIQAKQAQEQRDAKTHAATVNMMRQTAGKRADYGTL